MASLRPYFVDCFVLLTAENIFRLEVNGLEIVDHRIFWNE